MWLTDWYESLARDGHHHTLVRIAQFDERVVEILARHHLIPRIVADLPDPASALFLSRAMVYEDVHSEVMKNFVRICMFLSQFSTVDEGAALSELIGSCGLPEDYRMQLFNFSETYRHMILSNSYFVQRAVLRLLSYIFCDDVTSDAVAQLQYKSDILNHVNKVFTDTPDFVSWRFSVRVMSLAGGYNEDRSDVEYTEMLTRVVTRFVPEFVMYFSVAFFYAMFRFYPKRVRGITPRWLARHRALFSATYCGIMGLLLNSLTEYRTHNHRVLYELRRSQEMRRRRGAARRGVEYEPNKYFDSLEGVTRRVFGIQMQSYGIIGGMLTFSMLPLTKVQFPKWIGDVTWRYPFVPRFFPCLVGLHAASRCAVPFTVAPFVMTTLYYSNSGNVSLYDRYVDLRYRLWHRRTETKFDTSTSLLEDVTADPPRKGK